MSITPILPGSEELEHQMQRLVGCYSVGLCDWIEWWDKVSYENGKVRRGSLSFNHKESVSIHIKTKAKKVNKLDMTGLRPILDGYPENVVIPKMLVRPQHVYALHPEATIPNTMVQPRYPYGTYTGSGFYLNPIIGNKYEAVDFDSPNVSLLVMTFSFAPGNPIRDISGTLTLGPWLPLGEDLAPNVSAREPAYISSTFVNIYDVYAESYMHEEERNTWEFLKHAPRMSFTDYRHSEEVFNSWSWKNNGGNYLLRSPSFYWNYYADIMKRLLDTTFGHGGLMRKEEYATDFNFF